MEEVSEERVILMAEKENLGQRKRREFWREWS